MLPDLAIHESNTRVAHESSTSPARAEESAEEAQRVRVTGPQSCSVLHLFIPSIQLSLPAFPISPRTRPLSEQSIGIAASSPLVRFLRRRRPLGACRCTGSESVREASGDVLEVPHPSRACGPSTLCFFAPVVYSTPCQDWYCMETG